MVKRTSFSETRLTREKIIRAHLSNWENAKRAYIPPSSAQAPYRKDFETGVYKSVQSQKTLKQRLLENELTMSLASQTRNGKVNEIITEKLLELDLFWRVDCLIVWYEAIIRRIPESRDYADWLLPYIKDNAFNSPSYTDFWMKHIRADKVAKNYISSLVNYYQMKHKITHGNPNDQIHACHLLDVDIFITADKVFYKVLTEISIHFPKCAKIIYINRGATSALDELTTSLCSIA